MECGEGKYFCVTDQKCKSIPKGYTVTMPDGTLVKEAKYEAGASTYGKMSIRNKRATGYGGNAKSPDERQKAYKVRMKKHKETQKHGMNQGMDYTISNTHEEIKRDEYGDPIGGPKISKKQLKKNLSSNEKDEKITRSEEYVSEDDMKGMSVSSGHKRPTKSGAGMTAKGVAAYRRRNPGSKLKTAVTGKVKKGSKDANRRKSYCARSAGQMKKFPKAAKDPNSRLRQARRRWKC